MEEARHGRSAKKGSSLPILQRTATVAHDADRAFVANESYRRKQLESFVGLLDHLPLPRDVTSVASAVVSPEGFLHVVERQLSFLKGKLAFGSELLKHSIEMDNDANKCSETECLSASQPLVESNDREMARLVGRQPSTDARGTRSPSRINEGHYSAVRYDFEFPVPVDVITRISRFEGNGDMPLPTSRARGPPTTGRQATPKQAQTANSSVLLGETLMDSLQQHPTGAVSTLLTHSSARRTAEYLEPTAYFGLHATRVAEGQNRSSSYFSDNLEYGRQTPRNVSFPSQSSKAKGEEWKDGIVDSPSHAHDISAAAEVRSTTHHHHTRRCCALDVDLWKVRSMMHDVEQSLDELQYDRLIALEVGNRECGVMPSELNSRALIEAMFFAELPTQAQSRIVCENIFKTEVAVAAERANVDSLEQRIAELQLSTQKVLADSSSASIKVIEEMKALVAKERAQASSEYRRLCDSVVEFVSNVESVSRERILAEERDALVAGVDALHWQVAEQRFQNSLGILRPPASLHSFDRSLLVSASGAQLTLRDSVELIDNTARAMNNEIIRRLTTSRHTTTQTNADSAGRWVTKDEELFRNDTMYSHLHRLSALSSMMLLSLEESDRNRIEAEEDDIFAKDGATWKATLQHYAHIKALAMKDAQISALQLDLAAMRSTTTPSARASSLMNAIHSPVSPSSLLQRRGRSPHVLPLTVEVPLSTSLPPDSMPPQEGMLQQGDLTTSLDGFQKPMPDFSLSQSHPYTTSLLQEGRSASLSLSHTEGNVFAADLSRDSRKSSESPKAQQQPNEAPLRQQLRQSTARAAAKSFYGASHSRSPQADDLARTYAAPEFSYQSSSNYGRYVAPLPDFSSASSGSEIALTRVSTNGRSLQPLVMPNMNFPSVPVVVAMALTLEDLGRDDIRRKEVLAWRELMKSFAQR